MRTPANRFGDREELLAAVIFLAPESASFVTGTILPGDGGLLTGVNQESFRNTPRRGADQA
jgi:NAD(P)-dependent dehydrogenase (short-subunit alcohol dehydrogenase family)